MSKCEKCKHNNDESFFVCDTCIHDTSLKDRFEPQTNADRIRAMSDEELAKQFSHTSICEEKYPKCMEDREDCVECLLKWLQQPADKGE